MRIIVLAMLLTVSAFAQTSPAAATAACVPENVTLKLKLDESQHALSQPETGEGVGLFHSGKGLGHLRRHNRDRIGRSRGGQQTRTVPISSCPRTRGSTTCVRACGPFGDMPSGSRISRREQAVFITSVRESLTEKKPSRTFFSARPTATRPSIRLPPYRHLLSAGGKQPSPAPDDPSASLGADSHECPSHTMGAIYRTVAASA
jgi:hypothetical protein